MKYVHSSSEGCHCSTDAQHSPHPGSLSDGCLRSLTCSSRIAPGSTVTSATAIFWATLKLRESAILTVPPGCCVGFMLAKSNVNGSGGGP